MYYARHQIEDLPLNLRNLMEDSAKQGVVNIRCSPGEPVKRFRENTWMNEDYPMSRREFKQLASVFVLTPVRNIRHWTQVSLDYRGYLYEGIYQPGHHLTFTIRKKIFPATCKYEKQARYNEKYNTSKELNFSTFLHRVTIQQTSQGD